MNDNSFEEHFDLKAILDEEEISYKENGTHFFLDDCPNCGAKNNVNIDKKSKLWVCWSCVKTDQFEENKEGRGNLWTLLLTLDFDEVQVKQMFKGKKWERNISGFEFEKMSWNQPDEETKITTLESYIIPKYLVFLDRTEEQIRRFPEVYSYLWSRGVRTKEQYQRLLLYYNPYKKRVVFPAITRNFQCVGSQSRDITERNKINHPKCTNPICDSRFHYYFKGEEEAPTNCPECDTPLEEMYYPKSLNTANFPKTEFFYGEQNIDWSKPVTLVEGPFDSANVINSIAFLGKILSDTQFSILLEKDPPLIVLYMDGDKAGDDSAKDIYFQLRPFFKVRIVFSDNNDDPGSFSLEENIIKVDSACQPSDWFNKKGLIYI